MSRNRACGQGSSILFRFNIESYGKNSVLGEFRLSRRVCGKSEMSIEHSTPSLSKPSFAIWSHSLRAYCLLRENKREGSRTFNGVYCFLHIQISSRRLNKVKTIRWNPSDRVLGRFDIYIIIWTRENPLHGYQTTVSTLKPRQRWRGPLAAPPACHDLYQIFQVLSLHIPQWSSNDALTVWWNVSGRFLGPIK